MLFANTVPMKRVKWGTKMDHEFISNFKLLKESFKTTWSLPSGSRSSLMPTTRVMNMTLLPTETALLWPYLLRREQQQQGNRFQPQQPVLLVQQQPEEQLAVLAESDSAAVQLAE